MGYLKNSNLQRIIKFLVSLSLFSLLFTSLPFLLHSINAFLMKIFSYPILKNYMFLLCNGLLVFIIKNSGLVHGSSSLTTYQTEEIVKNNVGGTGKSKSKEPAITEPIAAENGEEIEFPEEEKSLVTVEKKGLILSSEEKGEGGGKEIMITDEDFHGGEETEELNKKCEDFIRRMKAGFCSEPRTWNYSFEFDHQRAIMAN